MSHGLVSPPGRCLGPPPVRPFRFLAGVLAFVCLWAGAAEACSVCGCGDPLFAVGDSKPMAGTWRFAFDYVYLTASARSDDNPAQTESLTQMIFLPVVVFSPTDALNLVLQVPLNWKNWTLSGGGLPTETAQPFGLGDIEFGLRYFVWTHADLTKPNLQSFAISAGTSFPTGSDDTEVDGQRIDQHAQLGTGAWGPYLGVLYTFSEARWNFTGTLTGRYRTTNSYGYQYGAAMLFSFTGRYRVWDAFSLSLGLDGRYAVQDTDSGVTQVNTGGFLLALTPGLMWNIVDGLWLQAQVQVPIATKLYGVQSIGPVVTVGLQFVLH
jgi:hypothetical protein